MRQKVISLALVLALALSVSASANGIMPLWDNAQNCKATLTFTGDNAICTVSVSGRPGTSRITTALTLQRQNPDGSLENVLNWGVKSASSQNVSRAETCYDCPPGTYLLTATVHVFDANGVGERIVVTATAKH